MRRNFLFTGKCLAFMRRVFFFRVLPYYSFVFRKSFCSWLCPVGTVSEYLWKFGRYTFRRISSCRAGRHRAALAEYVVLSFFAYAVIAFWHAIAEFLNIRMRQCRRAMLNFFPLPRRHDAFVVLG